MSEKQIREDIQWLLDNPGRSMGSSYHDAGSCWQLIEAIVERLRQSEAEFKGDVIAQQEREINRKNLAIEKVIPWLKREEDVIDNVLDSIPILEAALASVPGKEKTSG